ncbi:RNA polymerase sigma-70 factor, ECF subfamily [Arenibacter nanhaiticus]|uniref:RNA polymerase sigma-70 factor, ECF subfamily n=1 Tax=Arenibacter nanhaiticus TaxID=558155 RepID=A0A1M6ESW2_9FLAO|nr:sigma-70 family RNA polymerase sigma factor [Arenibacter nanhaiticus]SHI88508.1 RNA polymerase sigma-70 factor, ECF subfamily [Arenibacter nanhaiticus]
MTKHILHPDNWVDNHSDYLFNYAIARVSDVDIAKDLVQDTFFAGLKSAQNYKGDASERTWLIAILKRKIIDHYRKINSKKAQATVRITPKADSDFDNNFLEHQVADPLSLLENNAMENEELGVAIHECISKLPKKHALAFSLKTIQGLSTEEVCKELKINPSNLWVIIHRARTSLMECLKNNWFKI